MWFIPSNPVQDPFDLVINYALKKIKKWIF